MPSSLPNNNPLSYLGVRASTPPNLIVADRAPTTNDLMGPSGPMQVGDEWMDTTYQVVYKLGAILGGAADWNIASADTSFNTPGASPQTVNAIQGHVSFTDVIPLQSDATLTMKNAAVNASSDLIYSVSCATAQTACSVVQIVVTAGQVQFRVYNLGGADTADDIVIFFKILN